MFIVTSGEYSDYHIDRAFSTEEKALEYVLSQTDTEDSEKERLREYNIEEFEVDEQYDKLVYKTIYSVELMLQTGQQKNKWEYRTSGKEKYRGEFTIFGSDNFGYVRGRSIVSAAHALKVAVEGRQYYLRSKDDVELNKTFESKVEP